MKISFGLIGLALILVVSGCVSVPALEPEQSQPVTLTTSQVNTVEHGVRGALRDPSSAVFGSMGAAQNAEGVTTVCGFVNGRNGFGGMTGMVPFNGVLLSSGRFVVASIAGPDDADIILRVCSLHGVFVS